MPHTTSAPPDPIHETAQAALTRGPSLVYIPCVVEAEVRRKNLAFLAAALSIAAVPLLAYGLFSDTWFRSASTRPGVTTVSPFTLTVCSRSRSCKKQSPLEARRTALATKKKGGYWYVGGYWAWAAGLLSILAALLCAAAMLANKRIPVPAASAAVFAAILAGGAAVALTLLYVFSIPAVVFKYARPGPQPCLFAFGAACTMAGGILAALSRFSKNEASPSPTDRPTQTDEAGPAPGNQPVPEADASAEQGPASNQESGS